MVERKFPFTKTGIEDLPAAPTGKRTLFWDTKVPHLALRITDKAVKSFLVYRWIDNRAVKRTLGRFPDISVELARKMANDVNFSLAQGIDPQDKKKQVRTDLSLGELFDEYIENHAKVHSKTWKVMQECFDRYLGQWKTRPASSIDKADVQRLHLELGKNSGHTTANRTLELLRAVINKGKGWGMLKGENPCVGIQKFKLKSRERFLRFDELPKLMKALQEESDHDIRDYVLLSLSTGARKMEVLSMRWRDVDIDNGVWVIPDTKNNQPHTVMLTADERALLKNRYDARRSEEFVFHGTGKHGHLADPKKGWKRILDRAKIEDLHLHDLRRTLGSYMAMSGASLSVIGNALNHKDVSTTRKVYAQSAREAELVARLQAHNVIFKKAPEENGNDNVVPITKKGAGRGK